jgi:hypothetical protein
MTGRKLGAVERAFWLLDRAVSFNGVNTARLAGPVKADDVRAALRWTQARHPLLRLAIRDDAFVAREGEIPLRIVRGDWRQYEREEINRRFGENELLCRATLVEGEGGCELIISHQHVIADATSAVIQMRGIIEALGKLAAGEKLEMPPSLPLRAPFVELLKPAAGAIKRFGAMNWFFFRNLLGHGVQPAKRLPLDRHAGFDERKLGIVHVDFDARETADLVARARAEGTTVQGALNAAMLLAAAGSMALDAPAWLACFSAVSLRDQVGIGGDEMGLYISQVTTWHRASRTTGLWPLAREIKRDLSRTLANGEQLVTIPMIGMFIPRGDDPGPKLAKKLDLASPATVGLSNIGRIDLPERAGPIAVEWFHLAVGPSVVAPLAGCASTLHGKLSLNLVFVEPLIAEARARSLAQATRALLAESRPTGGGESSAARSTAETEST